MRARHRCDLNVAMRLTSGLSSLVGKQRMKLETMRESAVAVGCVSATRQCAS